VASTESSPQLNSNNIQKIKDLENQLAQFKRTKENIRLDTRESVTHNSAQDGIIDIEDNDDGDDDVYDYKKTQYHINNFKKNKNKSGIIVEKDNSNAGISFGQLMESSSSSGGSSGQEFKMNNVTDSTKKTKDQILEEIRIEASSVSRPIEIH